MLFFQYESTVDQNPVKYKTSVATVRHNVLWDFITCKKREKQPEKRETKLDYYQGKLNIRVALRLKLYLKKLESFDKTSEMPGVNPAGNYMFKVKNTRTRCKICLKLTMKTFTLCSSIFITDFEYAGCEKAIPS